MKNTTFLTVSAAFSFMLLTLVGCASFEEIKKAADAGNPEMQYEVALIYRDGDGIPADNKKSAEYMMRAVNNNYLPAAWELVQDIYRQKDVKHASDFIKAYEVLLTIKPRTFADHNSAFAGAEHIKSIGIGPGHSAKERC